MVAIIQPEFDGAFGRWVQRILGTFLGVTTIIGLGLMATCPVADAMVGVGIAVPLTLVVAGIARGSLRS